MAENEAPQHSDIDFSAIDKEIAEYKAFLDKLHSEHSTFVNALAADARLAAAHVGESDDPYRRRAFLRTVFEFVEGAMYGRRAVLSNLHKRESNNQRIGHDLSDGENALLNEIEYQLDDDGKVKVRSRSFQPFLKYFRFTFDVYFKAQKKLNPVDYSGTGWLSFQRAYQARNRISHPKNVQDILVSDSELADIHTAFRWFIEQFNLR